MKKTFRYHPDEDKVIIRIDDGSRIGLFCIDWHMIGMPKKTVPAIRLFNDSWFAFPSITDLTDYLASTHGENITPEQLCDQLTSFGYKEHLRPFSRWACDDPLGMEARMTKSH